MLCVFVCVFYFLEKKSLFFFTLFDGGVVDRVSREGEAPLRFFSSTFVQCVFCSLVLDF